MFRKYVIPSLLAGALVLTASPALAAKGGGKGGTSTQAAPTTVAVDPAAVPNEYLGGIVWFTSTNVPSGVKASSLEVATLCTQNGIVVDGTVVWATDPATGQPSIVLLGGGTGASVWSTVGGAADCSIRLFYQDRQGFDVNLATNTFHAAATPN